MGVLSLVLIPFYLSELGKEQWGLVAVCLSLQGFLMLLELGLSQYIPKQFTIAYERKHLSATLKQVTKVYVFLGLFLFVVAQTFLSNIFELIETPESIQQDALLAGRLFLFQFFFSFANNVNVAFFNGIERQFEINVRAMLFGSMKHVVAISAILIVDRLAILYIGSFALVCFFEWLLNTMAVRTEARIEELNSNIHDFQDSAWDVLRHSGGFSVGVLIGMLTMQIDKLYLITSLSIVDYGYYVLIVTFAMYLMHLQSPLQRAFLPALIRADTRKSELYILLRHLKFTFFVSIFPCIIVWYNSYDILYLWLGDIEIASKGEDVLALFAIAVAMNSLYGTAYNNLIKINGYLIIISINIAIVLMQLLLIFIRPETIVLGGELWLVAGSVQLVATLFIYFKVIFTHEKKTI